MVTKLRISDMDAVDALLRAEGIVRDKHLDYTCGIFDNDRQLIATGSAFANTLRCFAVSNSHQGEGLLVEIVSHLLGYEIERGYTHIFLYTKPESAKFFESLGFHEIAHVEGSLVFMENRRKGFERFLTQLKESRTEGQSAAIVMNANPFTLGHRHLIETAAKENETVHVFVLSENHGPIPAQVRFQLVQKGITDLKNVRLHKTGPYLVSKATFPGYFLKTEEAVLEAQARLDTALFGRIAAALGVTHRYMGEEPANRVTSLYNRVITEELPKQGVECHIIPRKQAGDQIISASTVRKAIHDGAYSTVSDFLPESTKRYFSSPEAAPVIEAICREEDLVHD